MQEIWWKIFNYTHRLVGNGILFDIVFNGQFGLYLLQVTGLLVFVMSLCHVSYCFPLPRLCDVVVHSNSSRPGWGSEKANASKSIWIRNGQDCSLARSFEPINKSSFLVQLRRKPRQATRLPIACICFSKRGYTFLRCICHREWPILHRIRLCFGPVFKLFPNDVVGLWYSSSFNIVLSNN